ncbi:MAG: hypothetical protein ACREVQ_15940 [Burkholderiales bacterium]
MEATCDLPLPAAARRRVYSADDLCRAMKGAGDAPSPVDASGLDRILRREDARGEIEVQAAVAWSGLAELTGNAFLPGTVGDSVARNVTGPDGQPVVGHVRAITIVTADGELRRASRTQAPELFRIAVGGFGAIGPFYSVTLDGESLARTAAAPRESVRLGIEACDEDTGVRLHAVELLVPPTALDEVVTGVRAALEDRRCRPTHLEARSVLPESETLLCWAHREYVALHVAFRAPRATLGAAAAAAQLRRSLVDLALAAGGSCAPETLPLLSAAQARGCYPRFAAFLAEQRRLDPGDRVGSEWLRGARRVWSDAGCRVRWAAA